MMINKLARSIPCSCAAASSYVGNSNPNVGLVLFEGTPPDFSLTMEAAKKAGGVLDMTKLFEGFDFDTNKPLAGSAMRTVPVRFDGTSHIYQLSAVEQDIKGFVAGTPTWFLFTISTGSYSLSIDPTVSGSLLRGDVIQFVIGTVGDENSQADLRILSGNIKLDNLYRATDLVMNFI